MTTPNVLWIVTDDQPRATLSGGRMPQAWSRLVQQGTRFTKGYCAVPLCGPSRASFLTSMYPHNHQCHTNMTWPTFHGRGLEDDTIASRLKAAGYDTGYFGKYMNGIGGTPSHVAPDWDRWVNVISTSDRRVCFDGAVETVGNPVDNVSSFQLRQWLGDRDETPWFAVWAPTNPHSPYDPSPEHAHDFDSASWNPDSFNENSMGDKPTWLQGIPKQSQAEMDAVWEGKLEELQDTDDRLGEILDTLNETGDMANTYIFFVSDNGFLIGEHRLFKKEYAYEESAGVPFVVRGPGVPVTTSTEMVSTVDMMATTLEIAGLDSDAGRALDGRSMLAGLHGDWTDWRQRMLVEYTHPDRGWAMLCEDAHRFIDHVERPGGQWEFYDLATDPSQMASKTIDITDWRSLLNDFRAASGEEFRALEA